MIKEHLRQVAKKDLDNITDEELEEVLINTKPNSNCKHCYGRGHVGKNVLTEKFVLCRCVKKNSLKELMKIKERKAYKYEEENKQPLPEEGKPAIDGTANYENEMEERAVTPNAESGPEG